MKQLLKISLPIALLSSLSIIQATGNCCNNTCGTSCNNNCGSCCSPCTTQAYITEYSNSCCGGCSNVNGGGSNNGKCGDCKNCACKVNSKTTFVIRPQFEVCSPEYLSAFRDRMDARENGHGGAFQFALFGGRSTRSDKLAMYFTPYCKNSLVASAENVNGAVSPAVSRVDIVPQHFNVLLENDPERFREVITFCPRVSTAGIGLNYRQNLSRFRENYDPEKKHWYLEISTPLTWQQTTMGLSGCQTFTGDKVAATIEGLDQKFYSGMVQAFNQPAWCYGKINGCCECSKTRLADISLMLGYETLKCSSATLDGFVGILIPTGNKRCGTYVFEPVVGHGGHWGLMKGMHVKGTFWESKNRDVSIEAAHDINGMYLFQREEMRSFDLKNKPWSRYMEIYQNEAQAQQAFDLSATNANAGQYLSSPGINAFTKCLEVRPGLSVVTNTALILNANKFRGEVGYNLYWRQAECANLCCWKEGAALKAGSGDGNTEPLRTISLDNEWFNDNSADQHGVVSISNPITQYANSIIKACDLDMESASHPAYLANTLYITAGAHYDERNCPLFFDLGASYEFEQENITLNRWTLWAKGGVSF